MEGVKTARVLRRRMTRGERSLWEHLRDRNTGFHFRRQHPLAGYVLDFYCVKARLCVELDGEGHQQFHADDDAVRDKTLEEYGILTLRLKNHEPAEDLPAVLERITTLCIERTRRPRK